MIPTVTIDQLRALMQIDRMIIAGEAYYRESRVSDLEYDSDLDMVADFRSSGQPFRKIADKRFAEWLIYKVVL